ncbi:MAG TPA: pilus assembly protein N-terminal domain-containing protein [Polyangiales bacterium]|nr:pilus assembly protein N-terminal domain-containing protein [Polyangiales bacterium]
MKVESMNSRSWVLSLLASAFVVASAQAQDADSRGLGLQDKPSSSGTLLKERTLELNLSVGENQTIPAENVQSYSEGTRGVADVRLIPDGSQFVIVGSKPGSTTLLLIHRDGSQTHYIINVFQRGMELVEREIGQLLAGTTGVRVRRVGARFFVEGGVSSEPELKRIQQIAALYPGQVESLVVLGGVAAERKLNIRVDFFFVQYDRSKSYAVGVSWPGRIGNANLSANFDLLAGAVTSAQAAVVQQPLPSLDLAAANGWAKVLKHSTVITSNGSEAKFNSGGEQNYLVTTGFAAQLQQLAFGTYVTVLPRFDPATGELEVKLAAEVMDLTPAFDPGANLPGRSVSKLDTLVALKLGQSIVLSGIRTRSERHTVNGLPWLSEIPVIGALFGSHKNAWEEVEGAIFVVPSVIESVPKSARQIIDETLVQYEEFAGDMSEIKTWEQDPGTAPGVRMTREPTSAGAPAQRAKP